MEIRQTFHSDERTSIAIDYASKVMQVYYEERKCYYLYPWHSSTNAKSGLEYTFEAGDLDYEGTTKTNN